MKTSLLFAKFTLSVVAFYVYFSFAFMGAFNHMTYPKSATNLLAKVQPASKSLLVVKATKTEPIRLQKAGFIF